MAGRHHHQYSTESTDNCFPLSIAITTLVYNFLVALACGYLPDHDPLHIGLSIQVYAWAGTVLSILGLVGIVSKNSSLTTTFAHFLLLDTFISAIVRLLILHFFFEAFYDHNICTTPLHDPTWTPRNLRHNIVTSVVRDQEKEYRWWQATTTHQERCNVALGAVQVVLVALLICLTVAQGSLAVTMRRVGKELDIRRRRVGKELDIQRWRRSGNHNTAVEAEGTVVMARARCAAEKPCWSSELLYIDDDEKRGVMDI